MNCHICSVLFPNSNCELQYLHGMTPVMEAGDLKHISGSMYDSVDNLAGTAKLAPTALGYSMQIFKKSLVPTGSMIGDILPEEYLVGMTHGSKNETDLVLRSVGLIFFVPMTWNHVTGSIRNSKVIDNFSALASNNDDPHDWIHSIVQSINDTAEVGIICANIAGKETTYIHPSYSSAYWHFYAPLINLTVVTPADMPRTEFFLICSVVGITSVSSVPTPPAAHISAPRTTFVREDDKNEKADIKELLTFYKGLLMNGDINWETKENSNLEEPALTLAFINSLKKSSVSGLILMTHSSESSSGRPAPRIDPVKLTHNPLKKRNRKQYRLLLWALATTKFNWNYPVF